MVAQMVKNPPAMQEIQVRSLGQEDALEKEWQSTPVFLPEESHAQKSPGATVHRVAKESDMTERLNNNNTCFSGFFHEK